MIAKFIKGVSTLIRNFKYTFQPVTSTGCGKFCVQIILRRHGMLDNRTDNINNLRTMKEIADFMRKNGFLPNGVKFNNFLSLLDFCQKNSVDILLLLERNGFFTPKLRHWVVLEKINTKGVLLCDPIFGQMYLSVKQLQDFWHGYGLILRKRHDNTI